MRDRARWRAEVAFALVLAVTCAPSRLLHQDAATMSVVWPAVGVAAMWFARPGRHWLRGLRAVWVVAAVVSTSVLAGMPGPVTMVVATAASTLAGGLAGCWSMRRAWPGASSLHTLADGVRLVAVAALTGVVSAAALAAVAVLGQDRFLQSQVVVTLARDGLGIFLVGFLLLAWREHTRPASRRWHLRLAVEAVATVLVYGIVLAPGGRLSAPYLALPLTLVIALVSDTLRAAVHAALVAAITVALSPRPDGPFRHGDAFERFAVGQSFVVVVALTAMGLALVRCEQLAAVAQARSTATRLRRSIDRSTIAQLTIALDEADDLAIGRANPAAHELLDAPTGTLVGRSGRTCVAPSHRATLDRVIAELRDDARDQWEGELLLQLPDGTCRWALATIADMEHEDDAGHAWLTVQLVDISARKDMEEHLAHQALHDDLTGLANRELLQQRIERSLTARGATSVGLLFFDLDNFKHVNDSLGHSAGDHVISVIADRLTDGSRVGDTVARIGGDEFVMCCPGVTDEQAMGIARRLLGTIGAPIRLGDQDVTITASIGVALAGPESTTEELMQRADVAMYAAKDRGRARVERFADHLAERSSRQLVLDHALRVALRDEQFVVHYQPVVEIATGATIGVEALVRWQHPERGLLLPAEWLDVAENTELMPDLDSWVLHQACRQVAEVADPELTLYVNVSARQLRNADMLLTTLRALESSGLSPRRLVLELTETHLIEVHDTLMTDLLALRALGIRIAVDDFGTGFSSLRRLVDLPVDVLKIDRGFVEAMHDDPRAATVVNAIVGMASALRLGLIAEGVETAEQADALALVGCDVGQGYLWSRPGPASVVLGAAGAGLRADVRQGSTATASVP